MNALIQVINHLIHLNKDEEEIIKTLFTPLHLRSGEYFLEEGKVCKHVGFIESGLVRYFLIDDGAEKTVYFSKENEFVSNYQSFLPKKPSNTNIQAIEETYMYFISYDNLQRLYEKIKGGERFGRLAIEQIFVNSIEQSKSLYKDPPETRYRQFLEMYPDLVQRLPQYYIASYIGIKPESLSRIRKRMVAKK
jgi:CRP-like cAMP-binding protein